MKSRRAVRRAGWLLLLGAAVPALLAGRQSPYTLADIAWMEGHWVMESRQGRAEEIWTVPAEGTMVGCFRWVMPGGRQVLEFLVVRELEEGVEYRFKHYDPDYRPWEVDAPNTYRLTEVRGERAVFTNVAWNGRVPQRMVYARTAPDRLEFRGESPEAEGEPLVLSFTRQIEGAPGSAGVEAASQADHDRRIDYVELSVGDLDEAKRFYRDVFGWSFTDWGPDYASFHDGRLGGGLARHGEGVSKEPLIVLYVEDLERMRETVAVHGGTIVREIFGFPGGRRFHFRDPAGHELAIWSDGVPAD